MSGDSAYSTYRQAQAVPSKFLVRMSDTQELRVKPCKGINEG
jgi:hypothetical protein